MYISKIISNDCFLKNNIRLTKINKKEDSVEASFIVENIDYTYFFNINFNGTHRDLCSKFVEFANNFDPDNFIEDYIKERDSELGTHRSLIEMCEIAKKIQLYLTNAKISIQFRISFTNTDLREDLINETELLYKGAPDGGITDADTILADKLKKADHKATGIALEVIRIWRDSSDKSAVEALFYNLTDTDFLDYLDECVEKTTRPVDYVQTISDFIYETARCSVDGTWYAKAKYIAELYNLKENEYFAIQGDIVDNLCKRKEVCDLTDVGDGSIDIAVFEEFRNPQEN